MAYDDNKSEELSEREQLIRAFAKENYKEPEVPSILESEPEKPAEQPPVAAEQAPEAEKPKEADIPAETTADKPQEQPEKHEKLVPLEALKEEREKRKREAAERKALEAKIAEYERKVVPSEPEPINDYEEALRGLQRKVAAMEIMETRREELARLEAQREQANRLQQMLESSDVDLTNEGYPGFKYMTAAVTQELQRLRMQDEELAAALDNPTGWKKIYKEAIFPAFRAQFEKAVKDKHFEKKVEAKEKANLVTNPGKSEKVSDKKDPDTMTEDEMRQAYLKLRRGA